MKKVINACALIKIVQRSMPSTFDKYYHTFSFKNFKGWGDFFAFGEFHF